LLSGEVTDGFVAPVFSLGRVGLTPSDPGYGICVDVASLRRERKKSVKDGLVEIMRAKVKVSKAIQVCLDSLAGNVRSRRSAPRMVMSFGCWKGLYGGRLRAFQGM
jgi:hypothetical protein